jgi:phospholipase A1
VSQAVVLIPGIMGSVLYDDHELVWPGSLAELLLPYKHMAQLLKPQLQATDVIRSVSISKQYTDILDSLEGAGFHEKGEPPTLLAFAYDWRKDNALAALGLADAVDNFAKPLGAGAEITLLAHSMGGLVSRYYLESGLYEKRGGFSAVKRLITMGTPHLGSPLALTAALGLEKRLFLSAKQVQTLANDKNFAALYQLLPPRSVPFAWDRNEHARFSGIDVYADPAATQLELCRDNLDAAARFHQAINISKKPPNVRYFCFVGTQQTTLNEVRVTLSRGPSNGVQKSERKDAGDGTVPFWSGSLSGLQSVAVSGEHGELYKTAALKQVLGVLLDAETLMEAVGDTPEMSLRNKVVTPGGSVHAVIDFPRGTVRVIAELRLRPEMDSAGNIQANAPATLTLPISYEGPTIDHLEVLITAPDFAGVYRVEYVDTESATVQATTELFVQRTI